MNKSVFGTLGKLALSAALLATAATDVEAQRRRGNGGGGRPGGGGVIITDGPGHGRNFQNIMYLNQSYRRQQSFNLHAQFGNDLQSVTVTGYALGGRGRRGGGAQGGRIRLQQFGQQQQQVLSRGQFSSSVTFQIAPSQQRNSDAFIIVQPGTYIESISVTRRFFGGGGGHGGGFGRITYGGRLLNPRLIGYGQEIGVLASAKRAQNQSGGQYIQNFRGLRLLGARIVIRKPARNLDDSKAILFVNGYKVRGSRRFLQNGRNDLYFDFRNLRDQLRNQGIANNLVVGRGIGTVKLKIRGEEVRIKRVEIDTKVPRNQRF